MKSLYKKNIGSNILLFLVVLSSAWGVLWSLTADGIIEQRYFTNQANLLVFITVFLVFINKHDQKWFKYLAIVTLVNIAMTGFIYHIMLASPPIAFQSHLTHTITPILYVLFYFIGIEETIKLKQFWIALIYPFLYFLFFIITGPFTGFYPYWFMNVGAYGFGEIMKFVGLLMFPAIALLSWVMIFGKNIVHQKIKG